MCKIRQELGLSETYVSPKLLRGVIPSCLLVGRSVQVARHLHVVLLPCIYITKSHKMHVKGSTIKDSNHSMQ